jgi:CHAT domain-containing protein
MKQRLTQTKLTFILLAVCTFSFAQIKNFPDLIKKMYHLEKSEDYNNAKKEILLFRKTNKYSSRETIFLNNYVLFYDYLLSENQELKNINLPLQNLLELKDRLPHESELLVNIFSSKYHFVAYNSSFEASLKIALEGYNLKDFKQIKPETKTDYLYDLGYLFDKVGNSFEGIKFYKKSLALYIRQIGGYNTDVALNYNNLAYAYTNVYDKRNVIYYYQKAAKIWEDVYKNAFDKNDYLLTVHRNLMYQYIEYGALEEAKKSFIKYNYFYKKKYQMPTAEAQKTALVATMEFYYANSLYHTAIGDLKQAEHFATRLENDKTIDFADLKNLRYLLGCKLGLANAWFDKNNFEKVISISEQALQLATNAKYSDYIVSNSLLLASSYKELKQFDKSLLYIEKGKTSIEPAKFSQQKYQLDYTRAEILTAQNDNKKALVVIKNNIENLVFDISKKRKTIQNIRFGDVQDLVSNPFIGLFAKSGKFYYDEFKRSKNKESLAIAENLYQISSKLFKEYYLQGEYNEELSKVQSEISEGLLLIGLEKKMGFQDKIDLLNSIEQNASQHLIKEYQQKVNRQNNKNNQIVTLIKETENELNFYKSKKYSSTHDNKIVQTKAKLVSKLDSLKQSASEIEQNIAKTVGANFDLKNLLPFIKKEETILKFYVTKNNVFRVAISPTEIQIKNLGSKYDIQQKIQHFNNANQNLQSKHLENLSSLYSILLPRNTSRQLTIIPDNFLNYLPFESLYNVAKNQYLIQNHTVAYEYTVAFLLLHKQFPFQKSSNSLVAFSPNYNRKTVSKIRAGFNDLVYAKQESKQIVALFDGTLFGDERATKSNFLQQMQNFGIFHLAMHSQLFENDFNKSCLVFSNQEKVRFSELYGMNFPAQMVVLSACDTGNGTLKSGEGLMSISRALTSAGVQCTVKSLWQVPDKETAEIMVSFYENLKQGQTKDEALAQAKRTFIQNNPLKNHPYYWAGFVINGEMSPIESNNNWLIFVGMAGIAALVIFVIRKKLINKGN